MRLFEVYVKLLNIGTSINSGILHRRLREQVPFKWVGNDNNYNGDAEVLPLRADWRDGWIIQVICKPPLIFLIWSSEERNGKRANSQEKHTAIKDRLQQRQDRASCCSCDQELPQRQRQRHRKRPLSVFRSEKTTLVVALEIKSSSQRTVCHWSSPEANTTWTKFRTFTTHTSLYFTPTHV